MRSSFPIGFQEKFENIAKFRKMFQTNIVPNQNLNTTLFSIFFPVATRELLAFGRLFLKLMGLITHTNNLHQSPAVIKNFINVLNLPKPIMQVNSTLQLLVTLDSPIF